MTGDERAQRGAARPQPPTRGQPDVQGDGELLLLRSPSPPASSVSAAAAQQRFRRLVVALPGLVLALAAAALLVRSAFPQAHNLGLVHLKLTLKASVQNKAAAAPVGSSSSSTASGGRGTGATNSASGSGGMGPRAAAAQTQCATPGSAQPSVVLMSAKCINREGKEFAVGGLCNQLWGLITSMAIARQLSDAVGLAVPLELPTIFFHEEVGNYTVFQFLWKPMRLEDILDVAALASNAADHGLVVLPRPLNVSNAVTVKWDRDFQPWDMTTPRSTAVARAALYKAHAERNSSCSHAVYRLEHCGAMGSGLGDPWFAAAFGMLRFAPHLVRIADRIIERMRAHSGGFTGVHLRIEYDYIAHPWMGARKTEFADKCPDSLTCVDALYVPALEAANFSADRPMYVASGIALGQPELMPAVEARLRKYASSVHWSTSFEAAELQGLVPEQRSAVGLMVMIAADDFVGMPMSSFTNFVAAVRAHHNPPGRRRSKFVFSRARNEQRFQGILPPGMR